MGFNIGYKITKDITASLVAGIDFRETPKYNLWQQISLELQAYSTSITALAGFQIRGIERFLTSTVRPSLTYRKLFAEKHDVEVVALVNTSGEY